ncbi:hypothetical protein Gpo141_00001857 [Globisporangium polare]
MATETQELKTLHAREYVPWGVHAARELEPRYLQQQQPQHQHQCHGLSGASAGVLNDHIAVLVGGRELPFEAFSDTSRLDLFELRTNKWLQSYDIDGSFASRIGHSVVTDVVIGDSTTATVSLPCERAWHASARAKYSSAENKPIDDAVLVLGGKDASGKILADVWLLVLEKVAPLFQSQPEDPESHSKSPPLGVYSPRWIQLSPTGNGPLPLAYHSAVTIHDGSQVVVLGGKQATGAGPMLESVFVLDLPTNAWSTLSLSPSSSPLEDSKALTARCCCTALSLVLPMEEPNGKIVQFTDEIPLEAIDEKRQQLGQEVIFIYGGFSELAPALSTTCCVLLDVANGSIRELSTPNVGLASYMGHASVSTCDGQSMYLFGGVDPRTDRLIDATSALHFWRPQPLIDGFIDNDDANASPIKTKSYNNGDVYVGEMVSTTCRHGLGKCTYANGDEYDGAWEHDRRCGQGTMTYANGDVYVGEWRDNQRHGYGIRQLFVSSNNSKQRVEVKHEGHWHGDEKYGSGTTTYSDGSQLVAAWESRGIVQHGHIASFGDGNGLCSYTGLLNLDSGLPQGEGTSEHADSRETYTGQWHLGRRSGHGVATLLDGTTYTGDWKNGKRNGFGTCLYARTRDAYTGKWVGGVRCGRGACTYANGSAYDGEWKDDKCHGHGRFTFAAGTNSASKSAFYEGSWRENKFCGDGALVLNMDDSGDDSGGGGQPVQ